MWWLRCWWWWCRSAVGLWSIASTTAGAMQLVHVSYDRYMMQYEVCCMMYDVACVMHDASCTMTLAWSCMGRPTFTFSQYAWTASTQFIRLRHMLTFTCHAENNGKCRWSRQMQIMTTYANNYVACIWLRGICWWRNMQTITAYAYAYSICRWLRHVHMITTYADNYCILLWWCHVWITALAAFWRLTI